MHVSSQANYSGLFAWVEDVDGYHEFGRTDYPVEDIQEIPMDCYAAPVTLTWVVGNVDGERDTRAFSHGVRAAHKMERWKWWCGIRYFFHKLVFRHSEGRRGYYCSHCVSNRPPTLLVLGRNQAHFSVVRYLEQSGGGQREGRRGSR